MVGASFTGLLILIRHIKSIKQTKGLSEPMMNYSDFVISIMLNSIISWGDVLGFGRPYAPGFVYRVGAVSGGIVGKSLPRWFEWLEKLVMVLSMISLTSEYFFYWYSTLEEKKSKERNLFFLRTVFGFSLNSF